MIHRDLLQRTPLLPFLVFLVSADLLFLHNIEGLGPFDPIAVVNIFRPSHHHVAYRPLTRMVHHRAMPSHLSRFCIGLLTFRLPFALILNKRFKNALLVSLSSLVRYAEYSSRIPHHCSLRTIYNLQWARVNDWSISKLHYTRIRCSSQTEPN